MAPKKALSSSSALRRALAPSWSISPAFRSASIAICLPGMASRVKRAATSAMRPEPLVMTMKFTITRMAKTMMPMTKLPAMTNWPNASMTWPAALVPAWPFDRMRRVEARLRASRSMVAISSTVGKIVNSSGAEMNSDTIRIRTDRMIEAARKRSSRNAGSGTIRIVRIVKTPMASAISPRFIISTAPAMPELPLAAGAAPSPAVTSVMVSPIPSMVA